MKAAVLAGGFGKRLKPLTDSRPKTMIEVCGIPLIGWLLDSFSKNGITETVICTSYLKEVVMEYVGEGTRFGMRVEYSVEDEPLGTGGGLKKARRFLGNDFFIAAYGDIITDIDPSLLYQDLRKSEGCVASIAAIPLRSNYGIIELEGKYASRFREKPVLADHLMNAGLYCFSPEIFAYLPERGNFEALLLPQLAMQRKIVVRKYEKSRWKSIDSHKDIEEAESEFRHMVGRMAIRNDNMKFS